MLDGNKAGTPDRIVSVLKKDVFLFVSLMIRFESIISYFTCTFSRFDAMSIMASVTHPDATGDRYCVKAIHIIV